MGKKLLNHDVLTGRKTYLTDDVDGLGHTTEVDVSNVLKYTKEKEAEHQKGSMIGNTQKHHQKIAEIPETLYFDLIKKLGHPKYNQKAWMKWLQDHDNKHFRTTGGRLI